MPMHEEGRKDGNAKRIRLSTRRGLYYSDELASDWQNTGRGQARDTNGSLLGSAGKGRCSGDPTRTTSQAETGKEDREIKSSEIDPHTLPFVMMSEIHYQPTRSGRPLTPDSELKYPRRPSRRKDS